MITKIETNEFRLLGEKGAVSELSRLCSHYLKCVVTYVLLIKIRSRIRKVIGRLGVLELQGGWYAYVGSARKNFSHRIKRHIRKRKKRFWHIDYVLSDTKADVESVFLRDATIEHEIAREIHGAGFLAIKSFGSSDCRCPAHMFYISDVDRLKVFLKGALFSEIDSRAFL